MNRRTRDILSCLVYFFVMVTIKSMAIMTVWNIVIAKAFDAPTFNTFNVMAIYLVVRLGVRVSDSVDTMNARDE